MIKLIQFYIKTTISHINTISINETCINLHNQIPWLLSSQYVPGDSVVFHCCRADETWLSKLLNLSPTLCPFCIILISFTIFIVLEWTTPHFPPVLYFHYACIHTHCRNLHGSGKQVRSLTGWLIELGERASPVQSRPHHTTHQYGQTHTCARAETNAYILHKAW